MSVLISLKQLADAGKVRHLDHQLARYIARYDEHPVVILLACLTSYQLGKGHICIDLNGLDTNALFDLSVIESHQLLADVATPPEAWPVLLRDSAVVGVAAPLQFDEQLNKLYLQRYWSYENDVAGRLTLAAADSWQPDLTQSLNNLFARDYGFIFSALLQVRETDFSSLDFIKKYLDLEKPARIDWLAVEQVLQTAQNANDLQALDSLVPDAYCLNWQKVSVAVAATRHFSVISGGPGTGKTTTVTKLLALLIEQGLLVDRELDIKLVAPTGKAAARLTESIADAKGKLALVPKVADLIPEQAGTIHRLLGVVPNRQVFRHNPDNLLHLDVLVIDEASMVDLTLMAKLLAALPADARLILLGDKDQLSSVEAGSVLADICAYADSGYSEDQITWLQRSTNFDLSKFSSTGVSPISDSLCLLRKSYRFDASSGIGCLAKAVNAGNIKEFNQIWSAGFEDIRLQHLSDESYAQLISLAVTGYRSYLTELVTSPSDVQAREILKQFNCFQLLTAIREGDFGVAGLNQRIETALQSKRLIHKAQSDWYPGRPIMITNNDHGLGLYNGDIGICLVAETGIRVYFEMADGTVKSFLPSRLPPHQTVYAMTVHKSQGSEFAHTVMVLPDKYVPVLTRELVYTGITRAKKQLDIFANVPVLKKAIKTKTIRVSGLMERLVAS